MAAIQHNKTELARRNAELAGGSLVKRTGKYFLVRWPDNFGGFLTTETSESLERLADEAIALASQLEEEAIWSA